jgi:carbonic anhydrase
MQKLIRGILDFRKNVLPARREMFARLAHGQAPDALFITCSDSRVAPNWFASTDPGDLFVIRNVGNLVPPCNLEGQAETETSVAAAIEFSQTALAIRDIVVCGHSGCGAIHALAQGVDKLPKSNLKTWLSAAERSLRRYSPGLQSNPKLSSEDVLSQQNVLQQVENLKTYPQIRERVAKGELTLHAWWFDIADAGVYAYDERAGQFVLIEDKSSPQPRARVPERTL